MLILFNAISTHMNNSTIYTWQAMKPPFDIGLDSTSTCKAFICHLKHPSAGLMMLLLGHSLWMITGVWFTNFHHFVIFPFFHHCQNVDCLLNITFVFDRCYFKYALQILQWLKNLTYVFCKMKNFLSGVISDGALVSPNPGRVIIDE